MDASLIDNLHLVRERIARAAARAERSPAEITLIAVSKTVPADRIEEAVAAGMREFGENYVQEALPKIARFSDDGEKTGFNIHWHLIGHLQTNKVKYVTGRFTMIHSVDSYQLALEIERQAAKRSLLQPILIEVDLSGIATRNGVPSDEVADLVEKVRILPHLDLQGMMAIAPPDIGEETARTYFSRVRGLWEALPAANRKVLSMGMSGDFEEAIAEGATHVRIGSAIFGPRPRKT